MKELVRFCGVAVLVGLLHIASAEAVSVSVSPAAQSVQLGTPTSVDIVVSDLGSEVVSAFDLDLVYDDSIISATSVSFWPHLGSPFSLQSAVLNPGLVDIAEVSLLSDVDLIALQSGLLEVELATIFFDTIAVGESQLDLILGTQAPNDMKGLQNRVLPVEVTDGLITVTETSPTPEPGTIALFGTGLIGMLGYGWYRRKEDA